MEDRQLRKTISKVILVLKASVVTMLLLLVIMVVLIGDYYEFGAKPKTYVEQSPVVPDIVNGIHTATGLIDAPGLALVIQHCTSCHSSKLIIQNQMSSAGWKSTIQWMQETQNLWDLKEDEEQIITYLATNYAPKEKGRRANLEGIKWYRLE